MKIELTDYLMHRGDTGEGEGVALIWMEPTCDLPRTGFVAPVAGRSRNLRVVGDDFELTLLGVDRECYEMALARGLHVIWQNPLGGIESFLLQPKR